MPDNFPFIKTKPKTLIFTFASGYTFIKRNLNYIVTWFMKLWITINPYLLNRFLIVYLISYRIYIICRSS